MNPPHSPFSSFSFEFPAGHKVIHTKNRAWKKAKRTKNLIDIQEAKTLRNRTKHVIRQAKANFVQDYLDNDRISTKKFWEKINYIMPSKDKQSMIKLIDQETSEPIPNTDLSSYINGFFVNIGSKLSECFDKNWHDDLTNYCDNEMADLVIDVYTLGQIINDIDIYKSSAIKDISSEVLKDAFLTLLPQLVYMYTQCLRLNVFPDSWKVANVIPLQKTGDPSDVNNLRPISLLPLPGKILERIVHSQISTFLENNELFLNEQGGFRKGKSTIDTVAKFTDDILLGINEKEYTLAAFIDLKKAFDTVNHEILIKKLPHYGLSQNTVQWIKSYLDNRSQKCTVNGITSPELVINCGVPQGSILGPMLFLIYINDIAQNLTCTKFRLYADDTVLYMSDSDEHNAHAGLQHDLYSLTEWCNMNRLTINSKKTKVVLFGMRTMLKKAICQDLYIGNNKLQYVKNFTYLGVKLDCKLNFEAHALECLRLVSHKLYMISKIRNCITNKQALCIYKSKILPYFDYGDIFYMKTHQRTIDKLQKLQNRALRLCLGHHNRHNVDILHIEANVPKLEPRRLCHLVNFVYPRSRDPYYVRIINRNLRNFDAPVLREEVPNNTTFSRSILYQGAVHWNAIPTIERNIPDYKHFKNVQKSKLRY